MSKKKPSAQKYPPKFIFWHELEFLGDEQVAVHALLREELIRNYGQMKWIVIEVASLAAAAEEVLS